MTAATVCSFTIRRMMPKTSTWFLRSKLEVGSSRSISFGFLNKGASDGYLLQLTTTHLVNITHCEAFQAKPFQCRVYDLQILFRHPPAYMRRHPISTASNAVTREGSVRWATYPILRAIPKGESKFISWPSMVTDPPVGQCMALMHFNSVVFPTPLGPSTARSSPGIKLKFTPVKMGWLL